MRMKTAVVGALALAGMMLAAVPGPAADSPCADPICVKRYHFRGTQDGGRCQTDPAPVTRAMSHYDVEGPICPEGWHVDGDDCALDVCCYHRACGKHERYRDGNCHSRPDPITRARSHHRARCAAGEQLDLATGYCRRPDCEHVAQRPVSAAARRADALGEHREGLTERDGGPPPAVAGRSEQSYAARITGYEPGTCLDKGAPFTIRGARFGDAQGSRSAQVGGHGISVTVPIRSWSDTRIEANLPDDARIQNGEWYYVGIKDARGNWISNISKNVTVCRILQ